VSENDAPERDSDLPPERVGLAWIGTDQAVIVRWEGEPVVEHIASGVTPRHRAVGSVRRGPARPAGGGRVPGHGTKDRHDDELRRFLEDVAPRLARLDVVEVAGRGGLPERFAELLRTQAGGARDGQAVTTRALSRRPSDAQLEARLRRLADRELPRRIVGRYRLPAPEPTSPTGRPLRPAAGRRTLRPPRLPESKEIAEEVELLHEPDADEAPAATGEARTNP
jgi:hypothetical protein